MPPAVLNSNRRATRQATGVKQPFRLALFMSARCRFSLIAMPVQARAERRQPSRPLNSGAQSDRRIAPSTDPARRLSGACATALGRAPRSPPATTSNIERRGSCKRSPGLLGQRAPRFGERPLVVTQPLLGSAGLAVIDAEKHDVCSSRVAAQLLPRSREQRVAGERAQPEHEPGSADRADQCDCSGGRCAGESALDHSHRDRGQSSRCREDAQHRSTHGSDGQGSHHLERDMCLGRDQVRCIGDQLTTRAKELPDRRREGRRRVAGRTGASIAESLTARDARSDSQRPARRPA